MEAWAAAAQSRLIAEPAVEIARLTATREVDEVDGGEVGTVAVEVIVELPDRASAAALVERSIVAALSDVIGDREVGWTAHPWDAVPAEDT